MNYRITIAVLGVALLADVTQGAIIVQNPSFEDPTTNTYNSGVITGWSEDGDYPSGVIKDGYGGTPTTPTGDQAAYIDARETTAQGDNGGSILQYIGTVDAGDDGMKWTLTAALATRDNGNGAPAYVVGIYADNSGTPGTALGELSGDAGILSESAFSDYSVTTTNTVAADTGLWLKFHAVGNGGTGVGQFVLVDNVRMEAVPEPTTLGLIAVCGALGLLKRH